MMTELRIIILGALGILAFAWLLLLISTADPTRGCIAGHTEVRWFGQQFLCDKWERP